MDIVKRGSLPENREYNGTCVHCRTEVRFKRSEATLHSDRDGSFVKVECPTCKKDIYVDSSLYIKQKDET